MPPTKRKRPTKAQNDADLDARIVAFHERKVEAKALAEAIAADQEFIIKAMGGPGAEPRKVNDLRVTIVQGTSLIIDERSLAKRLGVAMWNKITTRVLDRKKLDAYLASGDIKPATLAAVSSERPNAPYVKITRS